MIVSTIPWTRLDPGNALARDYLVEPERVLPLFGADYRDPAAWGGIAAAQRACDPRRARLGPRLADYNRDVGGSVENAAAIDDCFCVVSGQQVGLLFGPAYTTYKLFTAINAARAASEELGERVVPLFWVESADHDWAESNRFFWKERRFRIEGAIARGTPVADIELDAGPFLEEVRTELGGDSEAWALVEREPGESIARWHVRNLARLVAGCGVVFVEPRLLREPLRPLAERIAREPGLLDRSLGRETGYPLCLAVPEGAYLFGGSAPRRRLARGVALPEDWSGDVASRVLVQNAAFRALAVVCGPAEVHYWAQLKGAHEAFGIPLPAVLPRDAATLVEQGTAKDAARLGLDLEDLAAGKASPLPPAGGSDPVATRLRALGTEASGLFRALEEGSLDLPPNTEKPFRKTLDRLRQDLERLAGRLDDARAEASGTGLRRYERVLRELRPRGGLQERTHSLFPYLVRHGPGLATLLRESFDPFEFGHYLVQL